MIMTAFCWILCCRMAVAWICCRMDARTENRCDPWSLGCLVRAVIEMPL